MPHSLPTMCMVCGLEVEVHFDLPCSVKDLTKALAYKCSDCKNENPELIQIVLAESEVS